MIRTYKSEDLSALMDIWYQASTLAHPFLEDDFVEQVKKDMAEKYLPNSEILVFEQDLTITGFIAMFGNEIGGLFVHPTHHSKGIGTQLVKEVQQNMPLLEVEVFSENSIGRSFYDKYGFITLKEYTHEPTNRLVLRMRSTS